MDWVILLLAFVGGAVGGASAVYWMLIDAAARTATDAFLEGRDEGLRTNCAFTPKNDE